jgi:hypothetical protein
MTAEHDQPRERPAISAGLIAAIMASFLAFAVVAAVCLFFFFYQSIAHNATFVKVQVFPSPRLQMLSDSLRDPEIAKQQAELERFRWIDREHGVFQIPIEPAMRLVAARGARAYDPVAPAIGSLAPPAGASNPHTQGGPTP